MRILIAALLVTALVTNLPSQEPLPKSDEVQRYFRSPIVSFQLNLAQASAVVEILNEQFEGAATFSANPATNTIYARTPKGLDTEVRKFIDRLEEDANENATKERDRYQMHDKADVKKTQLKTMTIELSHVEPIEMLLLLGNLGYYDNDVSIAQGTRKGTIIVRGAVDSLSELEDFIKQVDQAETEEKSLSNWESAKSQLESERSKLQRQFNDIQLYSLALRHEEALQTLGDHHPETLRILKQIDMLKQYQAQVEQKLKDANPADADPNSIDLDGDPGRRQLESVYEEAERSAARLADQWRREQAKGKLSESEMADLRQRVADQVEIAFETRQRIKRDEIAAALAQLKTIQARLDLRSKITDKIVQRRVEDLISGVDLSWLSAEDRAANERTDRAAEHPTKPNQAKRFFDHLQDTEGDVQIELLNDIDTIVVKGSKKDVETVVDALEEADETKAKSDAAEDQSEATEN